jgi:PTS system mannose-specific IID component
MSRATRLFVRSFLIQALWNPRDFQGSGLGWALGETPSSFNGHPYLSGVALGALSRLRELDGGENGGDLDTRFREALRAPLGSLGDALVWVGLLPASVLAACLLILLGLPPALVLGMLLLGYNAVHLGLRAWGLRVGLTHGLGVAGALGAAGLQQAAQHLRRTGVFLAGGITGVVLVAFGQVVGGGFPDFRPVSPELLAVAFSIPPLVALGLLILGGIRNVASARIRHSIRILPLGWALVLLWGAWAFFILKPKGF